MVRRRLTVQAAADELGISVDAARARVRRGSLEAEHEDGRLYVWLDADQTETSSSTSAPERELVDALNERIASLEHQLALREEEARRKDHLLAAALERLPPALEAPQEERPDAQRGDLRRSEDAPKGGTPPEQEEASQRRSWWRAFFGTE
jgi:hypothetical protein